ncbi:DUF2334 domain-containing protein [Halobacillus halophilus]|uniref:DUF2334 domain-containing protein n=1 Tax=Halobacillus halophilus TaxID=1570 RepID=UPI001CD7BDAB|nr:DUF2334 domain-containing protein [Halobacillus halophilus]MCA1012284.1 DUF2334 domain-containing protein [Halobacillus halophilus]
MSTRRSIMTALLGMGIFILVQFLFFPSPALSKETSGQHPDVLVVHSTENNELTEQQRKLDLLISHFTKEVRFTSAEDLASEDLQDITHLFYFGEEQTVLSEKTARLIDDFSGVKMILGNNENQFPHSYSFVKKNGHAIIENLTLRKTEETITLSEPHQIFNIDMESNAQTLISADKHPLLVKSHSNYYYADSEISLEDAILMGEVLHQVFEKEHKESHPAVIRLEDVNPRLDPEMLRQCADVLIEKDIPFMVAVTPVYKNPETGEEYHLTDAPDLLNILHDIEDQGASIILHGYTDQSGTGKTGDGFEFSEMERSELETRIEKGKKELIKMGLTPLALETPHYTISQDGYGAAANHFAKYLGQLQLTDDNWKVMMEAPYLTSPTYLKGMELIPETLRYVQEGEVHSIERMAERADNLMILRDSVLSAFYHPYLGPEGLEEVVEEIMTYPNVEWVDLKADASLTQGVADNEKSRDKEDLLLNGKVKQNSFLSLNLLWNPIIIGGCITILVILLSYALSLKIKKENE